MKSPAGEGVAALASRSKVAIKPLLSTRARKMLRCYAEPQGTSKAILDYAAKPAVACSFAASTAKKSKLKKLHSRVARLRAPAPLRPQVAALPLQA